MNYGRIEIKLNKYLKDNNISRNSLARNGALRYDTILSYCRNEVTRLDTDTLAKLCSALTRMVKSFYLFYKCKFIYTFRKQHKKYFC